ncbi:MAG: 6-bladed beta-propeller [Cyclobacteriaceae bacterium]
MKIAPPLSFLLFTLAYLILIISGCRDKFYSSADSQSIHVAEVANIYQVDPGGVTGVSLKDMVSEVDYTLLKLPSEMFFRETLKVIFHDNHFYFLDRAVGSPDASIFCFDLTGTFRYVIDEVGRGPGEYARIMDFDVTDEYVIIYAEKGFLFYDVISGEFVKSMDKTKVSSTSFAVIDENAILMDAGRYVHNKSKNQLKVYDIDSKDVIYEDFPFNNSSLKLSHIYRYIFTAKDTVSALPMFSQIVYRAYKKDRNYLIKPAYELDFGDFWIPNQILANSYKNRDKFFDSYQDFVSTAEVFETNEIIYAHYQLNGEYLTFIHDRRSERSLNINSFKENSIGWLGKPFATQGDWIINLVAPFQIEDADITPNDGLKEVLSLASDEGQPILVKFKVE